jgi:hypothetical protein
VECCNDKYSFLVSQALEVHVRLSFEETLAAVMSFEGYPFFGQMFDSVA